MNPKVSIVIPVYNGSNYLKQAIDSALAQTYKNIEIIVINDGSNDEGATEAIAKSYGNKIRYFKKENGGVATALNLGIKKMTGEYFSWLSHDDMYYPEKIEKQINFLNTVEDKKVVLYSNYSLLMGNKITPVIHNHEMLVRKKKYSLLRGCVNGITVLVPKSIIVATGELDLSLRCVQDYDYWHRVQKRFEFIHMDEILSITRIHANQDSSMSPSAKTEGDKLWIDMDKWLTNDEKIEYESTLYNYYFEMAKFLRDTPYSEAQEYYDKKFADIEKQQKAESIDCAVSVVIPFYNRPKETINSIKSVLAQTYKNFEIILVNDASTDDISEVLSLISNYGYIKLINVEKNAGPAAARNIGIRVATGDYIAFLDSDDEFIKNKLEKQLDMMLRHNLNISYTAYIKRDGEVDTIMCDHQLTGIVVPRIISNCSIATPTVIVKKSFLTNNDIYFREDLRVGEDACFWMEIAKRSEILLVDEPLTIVNINGDSNAYNCDKLAVGVKNILSYLLNDNYYSRFFFDISILCNHFYNINEDIRRHIDSGLTFNNYKRQEYRVRWSKNMFSSKLKNGIFYRAAKRLYHDGPRGVAKAISNRIVRK